MLKPVLIVDMDGTLLERRTVDELCDSFGLRKELDLIDRESSNLPAFRVAEMIAGLFKGKTIHEIEAVFDNIPANAGAGEFIKSIKQNGFVTSIATDSYEFLARRLAQRLGIDLVYGHKIQILKGRFTGRILSPYRCLEIPGCKRFYTCKLWFLRECKKKYGGPVITLGDGDGDYCMSTESDLPIAFKPRSKPLVDVCKLVVYSFEDLLALDLNKMIR